MAIFATTNRANLRLLPEAQWGETPDTGVTREVRMTSHSMATKKNTVKSNEIRDDRMVSDIIETEMMSDGGINFEFSAGATDDLFEAFLMGTWTRPMTYDFWEGTSVEWTSDNTLKILGIDATGYLVEGRVIQTRGFVNPSNNNFWTIDTVTLTGGNTVIVVTDSTAVSEAGNLTSFVGDANDTIIIKDGHIRSGTSSASTFDSNSNNDFSSAIAAGQLVVGQKIYVDGLGYETGSFTFSAVAVAADSVTVNDGESSYTFVAGTDFAVGASATNTATALAFAINNARVYGVGGGPGVAPIFLNVKATSDVGAVTVTNLYATGGSLAKVVDSTSVDTVVNFSGGVDSEHGVFTLVAVNEDILTVSPSPGTNSNGSSLPVTIRGSMLRNPSVASDIVYASYTIESFYDDVSLGFVQDGMTVNTFTIDANASAVLTGSFEFMGRATDTITTSQLGNSPYTVLGPVQCEVMNATTDVGYVEKDGVALTTAIKQIKLDGKAQLRNQMAVSSKFPVGIGTGRFELTGSMQAYFSDLDLYNDFLNHTTVSVGWDFEDSTGNTYYFTVPAVKVTADPVNAKGIDQDVMEDITFEAFRDVVTECMIQIDRFSSLLPLLG